MVLKAYIYEHLIKSDNLTNNHQTWGGHCRGYLHIHLMLSAYNTAIIEVQLKVLLKSNCQLLV